MAVLPLISRNAPSGMIIYWEHVLRMPMIEAAKALWHGSFP
jgi:hypothetical protein